MQMRSNNAETAVHDSHCRGDMAVRIRKVQARRWVGAISFPEAAILLVSDGDRDLWPLARFNSGSSQFTDFPSLCACPVKSDKSDWFWFQSIVLTKPFKTGMSLDLARGPDFQCMTKGTPGDEVGVGAE